MNFLARVAIGLVLCSVAAPTVSFADFDRHDPYNPYNQPGAQTAKNAKSAKSAKRVRHAKRVRTAKSVKSATRSWASRSRAHVLQGRGNGHPHWVSVAQRYKGTNPTDRKSLWCADFMNLVLQRSGMKGTSSSSARSFAGYGRRLSGPKVGAIAVLSRGKNGGHVGIVTGIDERGNPILLSGNHGNKVAEAAYPRSRVIAYVWPAG